MSRIIGCKNLHIALLTKDQAGEVVYETPVAVPSLINLSISDSISSNNFYSDDKVEQAFSKIASKEVTIELGYLTNELEALLTGKIYDTKTGALIQTSDDLNPEVAIMFSAKKSKGGDRYVVLYRGILSRSEASYATQEEGVEPSNITLVGTFVALDSNGRMLGVADSDDSNVTQEIIDAWFTQVPLVGTTSTVANVKKEKATK